MKSSRKKPSTRILYLFVISLLITFGITVLFTVFFGNTFPDGDNPITLLWFFGPIAIVILIPLFSNLIAKQVKKRFDAMSIAEGQQLVLSQRSAAKELLRTAPVKLHRIRILTDVYAIFLAVLSVFFCYAVAASETYVPLLPAALLTVALAEIPTSVYRNEVETPETALAPSAFPRLYALAKKAADEIGCPGTIYVEMSFGAGSCAGVIRFGNHIHVLIAPAMLNALTEDELYTILLHEFTHVRDKNSDYQRIRRRSDFLGDSRGIADSLFAKIVALFYAAFDVRYEISSTLFIFATSIESEKEADANMKKAAGAAATALQKTEYWSFFLREETLNPDLLDYAAETPNEHYVSDETHRFLTKIPERTHDWNTLIEKEIQARSATHPNTRDRIRALGVEKLSETLDYPEGEYAEECRRALDAADVIIKNNVARDYDADRKRIYLDPLEHVKKWEEDGRPLSPDTYPEVLNALLALRRFDEFLLLCNRAIDELPTYASHTAYYHRGYYRLRSYDPSGIDDLYAAATANSNYINSLDAIGEFCCMMGLSEELDAYREKALALAQKYKDEDAALGGLYKQDNLSEEHLPDGLLEEILSYIESVSENVVTHVYLVRKSLSEDVFISPFVIRFRIGTPNETIGRVMDAIFYHLDTCSDWNFNLFTYHGIAPGIVEKVKGSLVWQAEDPESEAPEA